MPTPAARWFNEEHEWTGEQAHDLVFQWLIQEQARNGFQEDFIGLGNPEDDFEDPISVFEEKGVVDDLTKLHSSFETYGDQLDFIRCLVRYSCISGGIRSGKTHSGTIKSYIIAQKNPGVDFLVTAPDYQRVIGATLPKYLLIFPPRFIRRVVGGQHPIIETITDNRFWLRSTAEPQALRAYEVGFVHMDEASYSPYESLLVLQGRMSQVDDAQLYITTTPNIENPLNWVYGEFVASEDTDYKLFLLNTLANPFLSKKYKLDLLKNYSPEMARIELGGEFMPLAGNCFFDTQKIADCLKLDVRQAIETRRDGAICIWKRPAAGRVYVAGIDTAEGRQAGDIKEGIGNPDFNCCVIGDSKTGEVVAVIYCRYPLDEFLIEAKKLMQEYNWAYCGIEINYNRGVAQQLIEYGYPDSSLYHWKDDVDNYEAGWWTSKKNRMPLLTDYEKALRDRDVIIYSKDILMNHLSFVRNAKGTPKAAYNAHDDDVMALAIMHQMRYHCPDSTKVPDVYAQY